MMMANKMFHTISVWIILHVFVLHFSIIILKNVWRHFYINYMNY